MPPSLWEADWAAPRLGPPLTPHRHRATATLSTARASRFLRSYPSQPPCHVEQRSYLRLSGFKLALATADHTRFAAVQLKSRHVHAEGSSHAAHSGGRLVRPPARRTPSLLCLRPLLPASRRRGGRLQGPIQPERPAARAVGVGRARPIGSDRE